MKCKRYFINLIFIIISGILFMSFMISNAGAEEREITSILRQMNIDGVKAKYSGTKVTFDLSSAVPKVNSFRIIYQSPLRQRKEYITQDRIVVNDGKYLWEYIPSQQSVLRRVLSETHHQLAERNMVLIRDNYVTELEGEYLIAGRKSYVIKLCPRESGSRPSRRIWVDSEKGVPLRTEIYGINNKLALLSSFVNIEFDTKFKKNDFILKVPSKTSVRILKDYKCPNIVRAQKVVDFKVNSPKYLPSGFVLTSINAKSKSHYNEVQLQFFDGLCSLSIFESTHINFDYGSPNAVKIALNDKEGVFQDLGLLKIVNWKAGGLYFTLIGELSKEEMIKIAKSID